jgi:hypothetical protein
MFYSNNTVFFFQFIARTVKDMDQWVAVICQASVQHIQSSVLLLPHCTLDRSALRDRINVSVTAENNSEIYSDAGSETQFDGETEDIDQQSEEEKFYQDITDVCQKYLVLESNPGFEVKPAEECPPLPSRRCLPSAFQDNLSDQDPVYDDIFVSNGHSEYSDVGGVSVERSLTLIEPGRDVDVEEKHSWVQQTISIGHKKAQPQLFVKHEVQNDDNGEEEIYDDVGVTEKLPKAVKLPVLQQKLHVGNGGGVQNRIILHETCHSNGGIPTCGHHPNTKTSNQFQYNISTTYKSVNNCEEDTVSSLPQIPTAYQKSKYDISNQTEANERTVSKDMKRTQEEAKNLFPRTPIATQRPEIPPRPYLKR